MRIGRESGPNPRTIGLIRSKVAFSNLSVSSSELTRPGVILQISTKNLQKRCCGSGGLNFDPPATTQGSRNSRSRQYANGQTPDWEVLKRQNVSEVLAEEHRAAEEWAQTVAYFS